MKILLIAIVVVGIACKQTSSNSTQQQNRIDSLEKQLAESYKPGFGEFMSSIQAHHAKLWFAGQNKNWRLADFEIHELMEAVDDIKKYESDRKESRLIGMIQPAIDSVNQAIQQKDLSLFTGSYTYLTNTCNNCHREADFGFNVVKIPSQQTFSNQEFTVQETK